jgi:hypothetical protein
MPINKNFQLSDGIRCHADTNVFVKDEKQLKRMQAKQPEGSSWHWVKVD